MGPSLSRTKVADEFVRHTTRSCELQRNSPSGARGVGVLAQAHEVSKDWRVKLESLAEVRPENTHTLWTPL